METGSIALIFTLERYRQKILFSVIEHRVRDPEEGASVAGVEFGDGEECCVNDAGLDFSFEVYDKVGFGE